MSEIIDSTQATSSGCVYTFTIMRAPSGRPLLVVYERGEGLRAKSQEIEPIDLDKNPEIARLYDFKHWQFRPGLVNDFLRAIVEAKDVQICLA